MAEHPDLMGPDADAAVEQLYAAHWRQLVRLSVLLVHDQASAEDVVLDAFVAMHGRWSRMRDPDKALAYLRQAVLNRIRDNYRMAARRPDQVPLDSAHPAAGVSPLDALMDRLKDALQYVTGDEDEIEFDDAPPG